MLLRPQHLPPVQPESGRRRSQRLVVALDRLRRTAPPRVAPAPRPTPAKTGS